MLHVVLANTVHTGGWKWTGDFTVLDLIAAGTNALNGALLARRPDHYKNFTVIGILLMAFLSGLGGGMTRDVLLNQVPSALTNPAYITVAFVCGVIGYFLAYDKGQLFREGLFQFMTSFSLPLYAIVGAQRAEAAGLPVVAVLGIAVAAPTAGRWFVDVSSGVSPKNFVQGEWFVGVAFLTGVIWISVYATGLGTFEGAAIALVVGYAMRVTALYRGWEEPLAKEPKGAYLHDHGRPLLGRKLQGKSQRELRDLGLLVEPETDSG
jgi:uncharacterized membrane protein YeiH